jgi:hypothetical protein
MEPARASPRVIRLNRVTFMNPYFPKAHIVKIMFRLLNNPPILTEWADSEQAGGQESIDMIEL